LVGEASTVLTTILLEMLFKTQSNIDMEQKRKEAKELAKAHLIHQQTVDATEETEKAIKDQLKDTDETVDRRKGNQT
jgi:hypothetical protein